MEKMKKYETPLHYTRYLRVAFVGGFFGVYAILSFCDLFGNAQTANMIYFVTDLSAMISRTPVCGWAAFSSLWLPSP